jgi:hypothetical protein
MKRSNLTIHQVEEGAGTQTKGIENLFNEIIAVNSPNLGKYINIQVQETFRNPNTHDQKRNFPHHISVKIPRLENKKTYRKPKKKCQLIYQDKHVRIT